MDQLCCVVMIVDVVPATTIRTTPARTEAERLGDPWCLNHFRHALDPVISASHGRQKHACQNSQDADDAEQFDQGKPCDDPGQ